MATECHRSPFEKIELDSVIKKAQNWSFLLYTEQFTHLCWIKIFFCCHVLKCFQGNPVLFRHTDYKLQLLSGEESWSPTVSRLEWPPPPPPPPPRSYLTKTCCSASFPFQKITAEVRSFQIFPVGTNKRPPNRTFSPVSVKKMSPGLHSWQHGSKQRLSHWYLVSGASDARHLLHPASRLVGGALRRASTGIRLTWASGHADRMRGGRGGGRRLRLPVCPTIRLHLNLVPEPEKQRC